MNLPIPKLPSGLKRFFSMSASVLTFPRRGRDTGVIAVDNLVVSKTAPARKPPQPRPLAQWMLMVFLAALALALCWLAYAGYQLHAATSAQNSILMKVPGFEGFIASRPSPDADAKKKPKAEAARPQKQAALVEPRALIEHAFSNFAQFENSRAEFPLRKREAIIASVQPGSPAQLAGIMAGDLIVSINGKPAGYLWDVFVQLSTKPTNSVEIEIKRNDEVARASMQAAAGAFVDTNSSGLLFDLPEGLNYMGPNDIVELARQFSTRFLDAVPNEWRTDYAGNVDLYSQQLTERIAEQAALKSTDPRYLRVDQLLVWQHENFMQALERLASEQRSAENQVGRALDRLGSAVLATAIAMLLALLAVVVGGMLFPRRSN
jgi:hypothetical protein